MAGVAKIVELLASEVRIINLGIEVFALELEQLEVPIIHVDWTPPAGGNAQTAALLAALADDENEDT